MTDRSGIGMTGGAVGLGAIAAAVGTCCVAPWAVGLVGVAGAVALARLTFLMPYVLAGSGLLLALAFYVAYRPRRTCETDACEQTSRTRLRIVVWIGAAVIAAMLVASYLQLRSFA
jgi:hypothetical protein